MYTEIYHSCSNQPRRKDKPKRNRYEGWQADSVEEVFLCRHCQAYVYTQPMISGVQNRNHCPFCLWSRHVDHFHPGDRMSACKAVMQPIGLTVKPSRNKYGDEKTGELMLIHRCSDCNRLSINRIAADDLSERLMEIFYTSGKLDSSTLQLLELSGIRLLHEEDVKLVISQLYGIMEN
jgi:hypothetical protein